MACGYSYFWPVFHSNTFSLHSNHDYFHLCRIPAYIIPLSAYLRLHDHKQCNKWSIWWNIESVRIPLHFLHDANFLPLSSKWVSTLAN